MRRFFAIIIGILREIGDESAYSRYLRVHGVEASAEQWRKFSDRRMQGKYAKAKCC
jgi:hypothetical protein